MIHSIEIQGITNVQPNILNDMYQTLCQCMNDYQIDRRGDVGNWVREVAMSALTRFLRLLVEASENNQEIVKTLNADQPQFYEKYVCLLLQQLSEKIDKVREVAGRSLQEFFKVIAPRVVNFAQKQELTALFNQ